MKIKPLRILLIHQFYVDDQDGGGVRWNAFSKLWLAQGHSVTILTGLSHYMTHQSNGSERDVKRNGIRIIRTGISTQVRWLDQNRLWQYASFAIASIWSGIFQCKEAYDMIIVTSPPLSVCIPGILLSWWKKIPYVAEIRDLWPESAIEMGMLKSGILIYVTLQLEKVFYRFARTVIVLTPAFQDFLVHKKNIDPNKIFLLPNAADFSLINQVKPTFNRTAFREAIGWNDQFVVVYAGAMGPANGLSFILEAAQMLKDTPVRFVLIGNGIEKLRLKAWQEKVHLENVVFLEVMPKIEVLRYILAAEMGISCLTDQPIFKTIYSNKTFDYFSCSKPVLMMIDGISRSLVESSNSGTFVIPENAQDLDKKIRYYMSNLALLTEQGQNGYLLAKSEFDREVLAEKYILHLLKISLEDRKNLK
jgi:glycosyltransferase involved in cell wall biosynthesis